VEASSALPWDVRPAVEAEYPVEFLHTEPDPPSQAIDMAESHHTAPLSVQIGMLAVPPGWEAKSVLPG
jgi:hypothetical protein